MTSQVPVLLSDTPTQLLALHDLQLMLLHSLMPGVRGQTHYSQHLKDKHSTKNHTDGWKATTLRKHQANSEAKPIQCVPTYSSSVYGSNEGA